MTRLAGHHVSMGTEENGASGWLRRRTSEEIRVLLARRMMSAAELARRTGITQSTMSRRMTGETAFDLDDLEVIASVLEVDVTELLPRAVGAGAGAPESSGPNRRYGPTALPVTARRRVASRVSPIGPGRRDSTRPVSAVPANKRRPQLVRPSNRPIAG